MRYSFVGERSLLLDECCAANVIATSSVQCLVISKEGFDEAVTGKARQRVQRLAMLKEALDEDPCELWTCEY